MLESLKLLAKETSTIKLACELYHYIVHANSNWTILAIKNEIINLL